MDECTPSSAHPTLSSPIHFLICNISPSPDIMSSSRDYYLVEEVNRSRALSLVLSVLISARRAQSELRSTSTSSITRPQGSCTQRSFHFTVQL
jgi:hypothetical protein